MKSWVVAAVTSCVCDAAVGQRETQLLHLG